MANLYVKTGVIDIGSNSVRLMLWESGKALYKKVKVTRLAEGLACNGTLSAQSIERTATAVCDFFNQAINDGALKVYAFATAAVRQSLNGNDFVFAVESKCGLQVEVIDGVTEAEIGYKGALNGADGGIIDVGGASTEITVVNGGKPIYSKSLDIGAVRIFNRCGQDKLAVKNLVDEKIKEYGCIPKTNFYGIGGTATTLAAVAQELDPYDPTKTDGYKLTVTAMQNLTDKLFSLSVEERKKLKGLQPERAEVIAGGATLLLEIMRSQNIEYITVSEKDNLEGYMIKKVN